MLEDERADTDKTSPWWSHSSKQSSLGILLEAPQQEGAAKASQRITEILLYGTIVPVALRDFPPTPPPTSPSRNIAQATTNVDSRKLSIKIRALPLSSDASRVTPTSAEILASLVHNRTAIPEAGEGDIEGHLLPTSPSEPIYNGKSSGKRKSLNDVFAAADAQRKRARKQGGDAVAAAASRVDERGPPAQASDKKASDAVSRKASQLPHLSRSSSTSSEARPPSRKSMMDGAAKRSSLSRITSISNVDEPATVESRNKETISRLVMAGMRLYGLEQRSKARSRRASASPSVATLDENHVAEEAAKGDEYKLVYHQAYKGTVFAFRKHIANVPLHTQTELLRDTVDRLLAIFCTDPLEQTLPVITTTPAGTPAKDLAVFGEGILEPNRSPFDGMKLGSITIEPNMLCVKSKSPQHASSSAIATDRGHG